ncbi:MAG: protein kinase [Acidobacteria bacterium]|jgi:serine/threonine protein kinase|nr:protein kinase [Acidobacteriota bacterium]
MKCVKCGAENADSEIFCTCCDEKIIPNLKGNINAASDPLKQGEIFIKNRFKVIKRLGKGGMGDVLLAEDIVLKRNVAIKSILTDILTLTDSSSKTRFLREAQTASRLDHPNICTIYEIYEEDRQSYIVMQYVDGVTVDQIIKLKPLGIQRTLDIAVQLCSGMIEAHENNITHRDIKPSNIMVDKKGIVKILDFGLAKFIKKSEIFEYPDIDSTGKGFILGTAAYLSPEQAGGKTVDHQTDIFSTGILLYEMLEGKNPFKEEEQIETLYNILNKKVEFTKDIPGELQIIIIKALEKDKKNRYASFTEMKKDLENFRLHYIKLKNEQTANAGMENHTKRKQGKYYPEMQKSSDNVGLGELVYKIKKYKASTERVKLIEYNKERWLRRIVFLAIIVFMLTLGFYIIKNIIPQKDNVPGPGFYIYLQSFKNNTNEENLPEMLNFLLTESLGQFKEFKIIDKEMTIKFKPKFKLSAEISVFNDFYTIKAILSSIDKSQKEKQLTITGKGKESILVDQVDNLTKRIYTTFFPTQSFQNFAFKKISGIFGNNWQTFTDFYQGNYYKNRLEVEKAKEFLSKAYDLLITKYVLADLFYFDTSPGESLKLINQIMPHIDLFTSGLKNRILALKARLDFDFEREIENLEKLKNDFPFAKEIFYELGNAYFHHGDAEKALLYYQNALGLDPDYSIALNRMGYCYTYLGNHIKAIEAFEEYNRLDQSANSFDSLGDGYFYAGELSSAEGMKEQAILIDKQSVPWAYETLADIGIMKAKYEEAEKDLISYEELRQSNIAKAIILNKLAYICFLNQDYKTAMIKINQSLVLFDSIDTFDNSAQAHWLKGMILLASGAYEDSKLECDWLKNFKLKHGLSKQNFLAPLKYFIHLDALHMEHNKNISGAEENFKFLLGMKPQLSYWVTYFNYQFFQTEYAAFLIRQQGYRDALREIDQCLEYNANYIPALWLKADIMEKMGNPQRWMIYNKIMDIYGESSEKNYLRNLLKEKLK